MHFAPTFSPVTLRPLLCVFDYHACLQLLPRLEIHPGRNSATVPITQDGCFCSSSKQLCLDLPFGDFAQQARPSADSGRIRQPITVGARHVQILADPHGIPPAESTATFRSTICRYSNATRLRSTHRMTTTLRPTASMSALGQASALRLWSRRNKTLLTSHE